MADADDFDVVLVTAEELTDSFGLGLDGASGSFLDKDIAVLAVLEGEEDQIDGFVQGHYEAGHCGLGDGYGLAVLDLVNPEGDDGAAGAHYVAVAGAADPCVQGAAALGYGNLFLQGFADAHSVYRVSSLVGGKADDAFNALVYRGVKDIVRADDVCLDGFHWEELAAGDLLQGGRVEDVVYSAHCALEAGPVADIANVELDLVCHVRVFGLVLVAHIVLLFLIA